MVNRALLEHQQIHRNRPVGTDILFGSRKKRFPQHGTRFEYQKKYKGAGGRGGIKLQRNQFFPHNPLNGFMQIGQPTDQLYANMFLANARAVQDSRTLVANASVAQRTIREFGTSTTLETTSQGTSPEQYSYTPEQVEGMVKHYSQAPKRHEDMAREMRRKTGGAAQGRAKLTESLMRDYQRKTLREVERDVGAPYQQPVLAIGNGD